MYKGRELICPACGRHENSTNDYFYHLAGHNIVSGIWTVGGKREYRCACGFQGHWLNDMIPHLLDVPHDWDKMLVRAALENM